MPNLSQQFVFALGTGTVAVPGVLIPSTAIPPTGSVANTASIFLSDGLKGDGYYGASDGLHTVTYTVGASFKGSINMQGTLAVSPSDSDWFDIDNTVRSWNTTTTVTTTTTNYVNFVGNFVWVRAKVSRNYDLPLGSVIALSYNH